MSLDKAISHGKEKRKPYRGSKAIDCTCRNHGSCQWCVENRTHKFRDKESESMKIVCTYIADDGEEFDTESECREYEDSLVRANGGVAAFDKDLNYIPTPTSNDWEDTVWFMKILDGEQADKLLKWVYDYCGICMDGLPDHLTTGEVWAWTERFGGEWYKPLEKYAELKRIADAIEKAVNSLG